MKKKIVMVLTVVFMLTFATSAFASGNWSVTVLPHMLKELTPAEADKALKNYQGGLLAVHSPFFSQGAITNSERVNDGGIAILRAASKNGYELMVPTNKVGEMWRNPARTISFAHFDKVAGFIGPREEGGVMLSTKFDVAVDYFVGSSQDALGKVLFIDSISSVTYKKFLNALKDNKQFFKNYSAALEEMTSISFEKNVDVTVLLDPVSNESTLYMSEDRKQVVVLLPIPYGDKGSKGANIKSVNGILSVQMFDTSSI